jgi:hypothetical protein
VLLIPIATDSAPIYAPTRGLPAALRAELEEALRGLPYGLTVAAPMAGAELAEPLAETLLADFAASASADVVLLYRVTADGSQARIALTYFDVASRQAYRTEQTLPGRALGLVGWNPLFFVAVAVLCGLGLGLVAARHLRGTGDIQVRIKLDKHVTEEVYTLSVSRRARRPVIHDVRVWTDKLRAKGHDEKRFVVALPAASTLFRRIPAGAWHVHLAGTFVRDRQVWVLDDSLSARVAVRRARTATVHFDLQADAAELRLGVVDQGGPASGVAVWLGDDEADARVTDGAGRAVVHVPLGSHVLHLRCGDLVVDKQITVTDAKIRTLNVNLVKERRVARGVSIQMDSMDFPPDVIIAAPAPTPSKARPSGVYIAAHLGSAVKQLEDEARASGELALASGAVAAAAATGAAAVDPASTRALARGSDPGSFGRRYQPRVELGRGAMGVVFQARDLVLDRDVAVKVVGQRMRKEPRALELFLREAKALAQLNHPNVVTVYDQGQDETEVYLVMELCEGRTLKQLLEANAQLSLPFALDIVDQLCAGLAYAHDRNVIHRDIKPANIFISPEGRVKLGDFGLARVLQAADAQQSEVRGTPQYMSPEQILGGEVDQRCDLYAVGCTLYELVTGRPPFCEGEVLFHHMHTAPVPPSRLAPAIPRGLDELILSCIAKDRRHRIASAAALRERLRPIRQQCAL